MRNFEEMNRMFKYLRVALSVIAFVAITLSLVCDGRIWEEIADRLAKIQIFPAALCISVGVLAFWAMLTFLFGRLYCSSICPMGTLQDIIARLNRLIFRRDIPPYRYSPPLTKLRNITFVVVIISVVAGLSAIPALLDPYALYQRFATDIIRPIYGLGRIAAASALGTTIALIPIIAVGIVASRHGRTFCNTLCPVGTALGAISRNSLFHFDIDTDKCIHCRKCADVCKASCIDLNDHTVDGSRCVNCFNCTDVCPNGAISYTTRRHRLSLPMMQRIKENISLDSPRPAMDYDAPRQPDSANTKNSISQNETIS